MLRFHDDLILYNQTNITHDGDQVFFLEKHSTNEGTWSLFTLTSGELDLVFLDGKDNERSRHRMDAMNTSILIPPVSWHKIEPITKTFTALLEFYCKPHRFFHKKHRLAAVHSDLLFIYHTYVKPSKPLKVLDVGSGLGRNALYLALEGHEVTAVDLNASSIEQMQFIAQQESLSNLMTSVHDLHAPLGFLKAPFDFIISTVSLQFLQPNRIPSLLGELQDATSMEGMHFLVFPIQSTDFKMPDHFIYLPESQALHDFYQNSGWSIVDYQESVGQLHKKDKTGKPIQGLFGRLLAQKV